MVSFYTYRYHPTDIQRIKTIPLFSPAAARIDQNGTMDRETDRQEKMRRITTNGYSLIQFKVTVKDIPIGAIV